MISRVRKVYYLKEQYVSFNDSDISNYTDRDTKESILSEIIDLMLKSNISEFIECAKSLNNWKVEILNSFTWVDGRRLSNGAIEGKNTYIKKIISNANGLNNFPNKNKNSEREPFLLHYRYHKILPLNFSGVK